MTSDLLLALGKANLAAAAAVLAVILLRRPVRAMFGARLGYLVWLVVPAAALAVLIPPRTVTVVAEMRAVSSLVLPPADLWSIAAPFWIAGALAMATWLARKQLQFLAEARRGRAGPAVVGLLRPRIVTPSNFEAAFNTREREVILAHERAHIARADTLANAVAALARCVCWFNPMIHVGAYLMRIDQELACDAHVVERHPKARRTYAAAMLKAELADRPLPLGCHWPAGTLHPLTERVAMLKHEKPGRIRRIAGVASLALLSATAGYAAWAAQPDHIAYVEPQQAREKEEPPPPKPPKQGPIEAPMPIPPNAARDGFVPVPIEKPQPVPGPGRANKFVPVPLEEPVEEEEPPQPLRSPEGIRQGRTEFPEPAPLLDQLPPPGKAGDPVAKEKGPAKSRLDDVKVLKKVDVQTSVKTIQLSSSEKRKLEDALDKDHKEKLPPEVEAKLKAGKQLSPEVVGTVKEGKKTPPADVLAKIKQKDDPVGPPKTGQ